MHRDARSANGASDMKLRQALEDFKVDEISRPQVLDGDGPYRLYILQKQGLDTFTLLAYLSKKLNVPYKEFGIAGLKDRHAITSQYLSIPTRYGIGAIEERNFRIEPKGFLQKPIEIGDLEGNRFEVTVRDLRKEDLQGVPERARDLESSGSPNYFDSQRFGSVIRGEFIARHVIKGEFERAVKVFLTAFTHSEKASIKKDKRAILDRWGDLGGMRPTTGILAKVVEAYKATKDWAKAFRHIPHNLRELYFSAYQSHIWNECIKVLLKEKVPRAKLYTVDYDLGELLFYKGLGQRELEGIPRTFKTVSHKLVASGEEGRIIDEVLRREGIELEDLNIKKRTGYFFKVYDREVIVRPEGFSMTGPVRDELNDRTGAGGLERSKLTMSFSLGKGSYATVITKRVFKR